ncbi:polyprenol monophosphomannose synthase [Cryobacterium levicorallinum]|uniref:Dolichol-phosphate mannosyltransferase n=1 Tax=Cryobacterium levicorallinum TaxID=995038 RepID=A0ABY1EHN9_9MICO|nr:polyprenol monophosphomannose synthase [Cryobacterium levicorallinum]GEP28412.1 dolichol-phosphate mannosyltransferase [Cryobacterium levicorallinum]SFH89055.1 dolichol-phosphate mannosyltransferase [Cryobacterium levicorallinum]
MPELTPATLIIIPTYNEAGNVAATVHRVHAAVPDAHILIVDDQSPDGTGEIADRLVEVDTRIFVLHRAEKAGLGGAYLAGFDWALNHGYELIGEFDADGSHPADALPELIAAFDRPGIRPWVAIGSRWVPGGSVVNWPKSREFLSRGGNTYARLMLGLPVSDATAGYRIYSATALRSMDLQSVDSKGYCFQIDLTLRVFDAAGPIVEIPIEFREREIGESKMSRSIVLEAMGRVTIWGVQRRFKKLASQRPGGRRRVS